MRFRPAALMNGEANFPIDDDSGVMAPFSTDAKCGLHHLDFPVPCGQAGGRAAGDYQSGGMTMWRELVFTQVFKAMAAPRLVAASCSCCSLLCLHLPPRRLPPRESIIFC